MEQTDYFQKQNVNYPLWARIVDVVRQQKQREFDAIKQKIDRKFSCDFFSD